MFTEFKVGDHTYKLRLTVQGIVALERSLGFSPLQIFMEIDNDVLPKISDMAIILHQMLQAYEHGISLDDTYEIIGDYIADGHTYWELVPVFIEAFQEAGFLEKEAGERKN